MDGDDLDALAALEIHAGWRLVRERIEQQLEARRRSLEELCAPDLTAYSRGQINALRVVLDLPNILREEAAIALKERRRR